MHVDLCTVDLCAGRVASAKTAATASVATAAASARAAARVPDLEAGQEYNPKATKPKASIWRSSIFVTRRCIQNIL